MKGEKSRERERKRDAGHSKCFNSRALMDRLRGPEVLPSITGRVD